VDQSREAAEADRLYRRLNGSNHDKETILNRTAERVMGARRLIVPANGLAFEVFEAGEGERLALMLHGFPQHAVSFRHQLPLLAELGYRAWAVNQRGYGGSSRPRDRAAYGLSHLTEDVAGLIDASGARSVLLIGHDWGAMVAWTFAIRRLRPLEKLVILNVPHPLCFRGALGMWRQRAKSWYTAFFQVPYLPDRLLGAGNGMLLPYMMRRNASHPEAFPDDVLAIYRANVSAPGAATAMLNWYRAAGRDILTAKNLAAPVEVPTLVIWGERDVALSLDCLTGMEDYVKDLRTVRLPCISHWVQEDAPEEVNRQISTFV
jgi:pimeloyl-ACP methyl ester carboxylesterase